MFESGHKWNERSQTQLATLVPDLRVVMTDALRMSDVPFQLVQGGRTIEQQREYFKAGKSKVNPDAYANAADLYAAAKHVTGPGAPLARAVDIIIDLKDKGYDVKHLAYVAGMMMAAARQRGIKVRWGANFDRDKELFEQAFIDAPHFEID